MTGDTPQLIYTLHDVMGEPVWEPLVLTPDDLRNGARTWDSKSDPVELERLARFRQGGGYYGFDPPQGWPSHQQHDGSSARPRPACAAAGIRSLSSRHPHGVPLRAR